MDDRILLKLVHKCELNYVSANRCSNKKVEILLSLRGYHDLHLIKTFKIKFRSSDLDLLSWTELLFLKQVTLGSTIF